MTFQFDEFDNTGKPVTPPEVNEVRAFMMEYDPQLARELLMLNPQLVPNLFRLCVDDMRRIQAHCKPRYLGAPTQDK